MRFLDACNSGPMKDYLQQAFDQLRKTQDVRFSQGGVALLQICWNSGFCLNALEDLKICSVSVDEFGPGGFAEKLVNDPRFGVIAHGFTQPLPQVSAGVDIQRTW
jgi:hypothetical protein